MDQKKPDPTLHAEPVGFSAGWLSDTTIIRAHHDLMRGLAGLACQDDVPRLGMPITAAKMEAVAGYLAQMRELMLAYAEAVGDELAQHSYEVDAQSLWRGVSDGFSELIQGVDAGEIEYRMGRYAR